MKELFADLAHNMWSEWMDHLFSKCIFNNDGSAIIPTESVEHWKRQASIPYADLPDSEKESDRAQAKKIREAVDEERDLTG